MSADLLERLIADIVAVTDSLVDSDPVDLSRLQTHPHQTRIERRHQRSTEHGKRAHQLPSGLSKLGEGVHKTVC
jgi:glutamate decarboxylase